MLFVLGVLIGLLLGVAIGLVINRRRVLKEGGWVTRHDLARPPRGEAPTDDPDR